MRFLFLYFVLSIAVFLPGAFQTSAGQESAPPEVNVDSADLDFQRDVLPILEAHCIRCHGPDTQESGIRLDTLSIDLIEDRAAAETWHEVLNVLNAAEMPPEDETQLSADALAKMTGWLTGAIDGAIEANRRTQGRVVLRRLNRIEYQNTMHDLIGIDMDYARDLPPDATSADGFTNNGLSLHMSSIQLEYYLQNARRALSRAIVSGEAPPVFEHEFLESNLNQWLGNSVRSNRLQRKQEFLATIKEDYPEQGEFRVRVTVSAELLANTGNPLLEVSVGYRPDTQILLREFELIEIDSPEEQTYEFRGRLEEFPMPVRGQGKFPGLVIRVRNRYDDGSELPREQKDERGKKFYADEPHLPTLVVHHVDFRGPYFDQWPPQGHRDILFDSPLRNEDELEYAKQVLSRFMPRAYRRPIEDVEVEQILRFYEAIRDEFPTFEETIIETLSFVLIRPDFLYLLEPAGEEKRAIGDWELASRLSYFLWSSMPDDRLRRLAENGTLHNQEVLRAEVDRMLAHPKAALFVSQFTDQWLQLNNLDSVAVSREYYPNFDELLKPHMREETRMFFAELVRNNASAILLLSADFTMLNEKLAKHYDIENVYGSNWRRVEINPEMRIGGILGHASFLLSNSTGADSHAVRRAVWIRDRLLNDPPAPPPPDVPSLEEADPEFHKLSVREQLEIHRNREACANCHRDIDPWGISLEGYDAVGLRRDIVRRKRGRNFEEMPVDSTSILPDGYQLNGGPSLRDYLVNQKREQFARSLVTRLMTFALGRRIDLNDQRAIDDIVDRLRNNEFPIRDLIYEVAASEPFNTK